MINNVLYATFFNSKTTSESEKNSLYTVDISSRSNYSPIGPLPYSGHGSDSIGPYLVLPNADSTSDLQCVFVDKDDSKFYWGSITVADSEAEMGTYTEMSSNWIWSSSMPQSFTPANDYTVGYTVDDQGIIIRSFDPRKGTVINEYNMEEVGVKKPKVGALAIWA